MHPHNLPPLNPEDYAKIGQELVERAERAPGNSFDENFNRFDKTSRWALWIIGSIIVASFSIGIWWNTFSLQQKAIDQLRSDATLALATLNDRTSTVKDVVKLNGEMVTIKDAILNVQNTIITNRNERVAQMTVINDRLRSVDEFITKYGPIVNNIDFMRQHGISFKEDFQQKNGYAAPSIGPPAK